MLEGLLNVKLIFTIHENKNKIVLLILIKYSINLIK